MFHHTAYGPHKDRDRTMSAIVDAGLWWPTLYRDVESVVRHCLVCINVKGKTLITGHQRSREYDGPFRYLIMDFVGPMNPPSNGNYYMFTCVCPFSGWYWAIPTVDDKAETAADCLF